MRSVLKKGFVHLPGIIKRIIIRAYEWSLRTKMISQEKKEYGLLDTGVVANRKNILIYHISGLSYGGTEKNLQSLANGLCDTYNVFFMYSIAAGENSRSAVLDKRITLLPFTYSSRETARPGFIHDMDPHIKTIIKDHAISIIITAGSGYAEYPINTITSIPVIMINIFGSPTLQKNIVKNIFISPTVQEFSETFTGSIKNNESLFIPVKEYVLRSSSVLEDINALVGRSSGDFIFGRIGRDSDLIFDEIGIRAFQKIVTIHSHAKYLIMAPPPALRALVEKEKIPNVFFLEPSSDEEVIWSFHASIDALAHFRYDGETFGLNIAESMFQGNPIISHFSHIWNAHARYLSPSFSRIAPKDDTEAYASYMEEFILLKRGCPIRWKEMQLCASTYARENFSEKKYIEKFQEILKTI